MTTSLRCGFEIADPRSGEPKGRWPKTKASQAGSNNLPGGTSTTLYSKQIMDLDIQARGPSPHGLRTLCPYSEGLASTRQSDISAFTGACSSAFNTCHVSSTWTRLPRLDTAAGL